MAKAKTGVCATPGGMILGPGMATGEDPRCWARISGCVWALLGPGCAAVVLSLSVLACSGEAEAPGKSDGSILAADPGSAERAKPSAAPGDAQPTPQDGPGVSLDAKLETNQMLREDLEAERHPSDGGGKAWLTAHGRADGSPGPLRAGEFARLEIVYEAGPLGIDVGGELHFQVSAFWEWDPPQNIRPDQRGYTEVRTDADGVELSPSWYGTDVLAIGIGGRKLEAGERIEITYGAGPIGAKVDAFAERDARLWFAVDGNGDGIRKFIDDPATVDIAAAAAARLLIVVPTSLEPGESFQAFISIVDHVGSAGVPFAGRVELEVPEGIQLPKIVELKRSDGGRRQISGVAERAGIHRIRGRALADGAAESEALFADANPIVVEAGIHHLRWADLHGHSQLSDGTGTPDDYFTYAREIAGLDIASLTDHDHWGIQFLDAHPWKWQLIRDTVKAHHKPGLFVTLLGYEWTSWLHGHRHVLYFEEEGEVFSSMDPRYETPAQLWDALRGRAAMTFAHHSAGGPVSTNWSYPPDPILEPITEVVSVHGSSEAADSPAGIYNPVPGNYVRDALDRGYRFGFIGSGDGHDGHPGASHLANPDGGGLAAIFVEELSRESVLEALRARRTYATNGARSWLEVSIAGHPMGSILDAASSSGAKTQTLRIRVVGEGPISRIDIVRSGSVASVDAKGQLEWSIEREIPRLTAGEYHYVRVVEQRGGLAWSSPIYAD